MRPQPNNAESIKQCCAQLYEGDLARLLLGDSFHPGGVQLTERLGRLLRLGPETRVLDVASGQGASAFFLAERLRSCVVGIDYSAQNVAKANALAMRKGLSTRVHFLEGDAERMPVPDSSFDAVLCECSYCTFPDKAAAAREFARVLLPGGLAGLSDLTRSGPLPSVLDGLLAWTACIADAQPVERYAEYLRSSGFDGVAVEPHDEALVEMVHGIRMKLLSAEVLVGLKRLALPGIDLASAKEMARAALTAIQQGRLGYAILIAHRGRKMPGDAGA